MRLISVFAVLLLTSCGIAAQVQISGIANDVKAIKNECRAKAQAPQFKPIQGKVEMFKEDLEAPVPFQIINNTSYPTASEQIAIGQLAILRDDCLQKMNAALEKPSMLNANQSNVYDHIVALGKLTNEEFSELMVALYNGKITYSEFAQKQNFIAVQNASLQRNYIAAVQQQDEERQQEANQAIAQALLNYSNATRAQQPIHTDCQNMGYTTSCNSYRY